MIPLRQFSFSAGYVIEVSSLLRRQYHKQMEAVSRVEDLFLLEENGKKNQARKFTSLYSAVA